MISPINEGNRFAIAYMPVSGKVVGAFFDFPSLYDFNQSVLAWKNAGYTIKIFSATTGQHVSGYTSEGEYYSLPKTTRRGVSPDATPHACPQCGVYHPDGREVEG